MSLELIESSAASALCADSSNSSKETREKGNASLRVDVSLSDIEFISFDTETTGLSPSSASLVELSGVKFRIGDDNVTTFSSLINPQCYIPPMVTAVHGITDEMVADAPTIDQVIPQFLEWIGSDQTVMVAHNAPFDVSFLQVAINQLGLSAPTNYVIDTLPLSRRVLSDAPKHQLRVLVEHLQLEEAGYHRALADSHHVRNILGRLISGEYGLSTWEDVARHCCVFRFNRDKDAQNGWFEPSPDILRYTEIIRQAIVTQESVTFVYKGTRAMRRKVSPIAVLENRGTYYLTGNCHKMKEERTFRIDKMISVEIL